MSSQVDVLIIGGGPAGLAAGVELRRLGVPRVLVVDREAAAGGIPRHADHSGFGIRDLHRILTGPQYARRYVRLAEHAGVELRTSTTVTEWTAPLAVALTSPSGIEAVAARAVVLATGCRERPRSARLVAGDRPLGVFTTGALQQFVHLHRQSVGRRAVVIGAEHVSFSAVLTLARAGAEIIAMITEHPRHQTYLPFKWLTASRFGVPILASHRVTQIFGRRRVEAVEVTDLRSGATQRLTCDTVVFTGDWIPDHELVRRGGLAMNAATRGPQVDCALRTSMRGVFAAGNLIHAAETGDVAALGGRHAARAVSDFLESGRWPDRQVPILCEPPVQWVCPNAISVTSERPPRDRFTWRMAEFRDAGTLVVRQGKRTLWQQHYRRVVPTVPLHASAEWIATVGLTGEAVTFEWR